jgi:agmatinase
MLSDLSRIYPAHHVAGCLAEKAREIVGALPSRHVYLTIDLDGFDPSVVPAVGTPVPGGLGWYETLSFLRVLAGSREIIGADVVELSPRPGLHYADAAAARLIHKLIAYCSK